MRIFVGGSERRDRRPAGAAAGGGRARGRRDDSLTRKARSIEALGAEPILCDVYDADALASRRGRVRPGRRDHQLTDLPDDAAKIPEFGPRRSIGCAVKGPGTSSRAAEAAGAQRILAQSIAWEPPGERGASYREHENAVLDAGGVVIRYGQLYGPGTYFETETAAAAPDSDRRRGKADRADPGRAPGHRRTGRVTARRPTTITASRKRRNRT